ncbi:MAG: lamin tail domain-containing protein [Clostridia bacterium]|nr:lamin tail domain-containing protein [Clostridia bacterium]
MSQNPTGRRAARHQAQPNPEVEKAKKKNRAQLLFFAILGIILLGILVVISPLEPLQRAVYTTGSEDGLVAEGGLRDERYIGLRISEAMASNHTSVPDENGNYPDWIEIWNSSDHSINLKGVGLSDNETSIKFLFPSMELGSGGRVIVFCDNTNQVDSGRPLHARFKLSSVGESVYLFDPNAFQIDSVTFRILSSDRSWALMDDGSYQETDDFSPGYENTAEGHQAYRNATLATAGALIINEVMASARSGLPDEDGEYADWVELYNTTDQPVSLDNYALSDNEAKPLKWRFPQNAVVAPHGYYLVFCSGKDRRDDPTAIPHTNFGISAEHDNVVLSDGYGHLVDRVTIDNLPVDTSYARNENGVFSVHSLATPGRDNADEAGADLEMRRRNTSGVIISEVMASNDATSVYTDSPLVDWVELYNGSTSTVDLSGYGLSDDIKRARKWQFPEGTSIAPGEFKVIFCDRDTQASDGLHADFKLLRAGGEVVCFSDPSGHVLDKLVLPLIPTDVSYGRSLGISGFFYYSSPTPGQMNGNDGFLGYAGDPDFLVAPGLHYQTVQTGFTVPAGTVVTYTMDGSTPTRASTVYHGETLELNFTTVLRARAFPDNSMYQPSNVITGSYFINTYHTLPIVSVVTDPDILYNAEHGMLTVGDNVVKEPGVLPFPNTIYREVKTNGLPQPVHVEYYGLDGEVILNQDAEFKLMGDYSLDMPQKSMKFRAKSLYGSKYFPAALFADRPYTYYKSFVLRNSGNDSMFTRLLDGFESRLLDYYGSTLIHQAWNPVVVYLDGVYWGHMNMRERVDKYFIAQFEGLPMDQADKITILQGNGTLKSGSQDARREYRNMVSHIKDSSPDKNPEDLQYILDRVDVDNYFEYIAMEMFVGNSDIGNIRWYRTPEEGAKWKWIWYDADYGLFVSSFNSPWSYTKTAGMGQQKINNTILLKLLTVPEYKDKFLRKLGDIFQTLTTENMLKVLEPLVEQITPEMSLHWERWGEENDQFVISEVPVTADGAYRYWEKRVERLRNTVRKRPNLLWGYIQETFSLSNDEMLEYFGAQPEIPADAV